MSGWRAKQGPTLLTFKGDETYVYFDLILAARSTDELAGFVDLQRKPDSEIA